MHEVRGGLIQDSANKNHLRRSDVRWTLDRRARCQHDVVLILNSGIAVEKARILRHQHHRSLGNHSIIHFRL